MMAKGAQMRGVQVTTSHSLRAFAFVAIKGWRGR